MKLFIKSTLLLWCISCAQSLHIAPSLRLLTRSLSRPSTRTSISHHYNPPEEECAPALSDDEPCDYFAKSQQAKGKRYCPGLITELVSVTHQLCKFSEDTHQLELRKGSTATAKQSIISTAIVAVIVSSNVVAGVAYASDTVVDVGKVQSTFQTISTVTIAAKETTTNRKGQTPFLFDQAIMNRFGKKQILSSEVASTSSAETVKGAPSDSSSKVQSPDLKVSIDDSSTVKEAPDDSSLTQDLKVESAESQLPKNDILSTSKPQDLSVQLDQSPPMKTTADTPELRVKIDKPKPKPPPDLKVKMEESGLPEKSNASPSVSRDLYVQVESPPEKTTSKSTNIFDPVVKIDNPTAMPEPQTSYETPEPNVILTKQKDRRTNSYSKPKSPNLQVLVEKGPVPNSQASPLSTLTSTEMKVKLEKVETKASTQSTNQQKKELPAVLQIKAVDKVVSEKSIPKPFDPPQPSVKSPQPKVEPPVAPKRAKTQRRDVIEPIRPETIDYIKEYNTAQKNSAIKSTSTKAVAKKVSKKDTDIFGVLNSAKVFALGTGVGTVAVITYLRRKSESSLLDVPPSLLDSLDTESVEYDENSQQTYQGTSGVSYLDSLNAPSSAATSSATQDNHI